MVVPTKYRQICSLKSTGQGYKLHDIEEAKHYFNQLFSEQTDLKPANQSFNLADSTLVNNLVSSFKDSETISSIERAKAGLCLRCYVSHSILNACKKLANQFGNYRFTYHDLIPYVLDDDGKHLIVLGADPQEKGRTVQFKVVSDGLEKTIYQYFSINILKTFDSTNERHLSLYNWAYRLTLQHQDLKQYLSDYGFKIHSDWSLLNQVGNIQLSHLTTREQHLVRSFQTVYRRHRLKQVSRSKCLPPAEAQLHEMSLTLKEIPIVITSTTVLLNELKEIAQQLQKYDFWRRQGTPMTTSLEVIDEETGQSRLRYDALTSPGDAIFELEFNELKNDLISILPATLEAAIQLSIQHAIAELKQRPRHKAYTGQFIPALKLYYFQGVSGRQIAEALGFKNSTQLSRILQPKKLLSQSRRHTVSAILKWALGKAQYSDSVSPNHLDHLMLAIETFVDQEIFQAAEAEMQSAKNRQMLSEYAQKMRHILDTIGE